MAIEKEKIHLDFGSPTSDIPPEALRRDMRGAFTVSALSFAVASALAFQFSMKFGAFPFPAAEINSALLKVAAHKASFGFLFNEQGPALLGAIRSESLWGHLAPRLGLSGAVGSIAAFALGKMALRPHEGARHLRGRRRISGDEAARAAKKLDKDPKGIAIHPLIRPSLQDWAAGAYFIGAPGGGKTTILLPIISQIIERKEKVILLDVKGDFSAKFPEAAVFAPWLSDSLVWDPSADIADEATAQTIAKILIPDPSQSSGKDVWSKSAQSVVAALIIELVKTKPGNWDFSDLAELLALPTEDWLGILKRNLPSQAKVLEGAAETTASVAFTVAASLKSVEEIARAFADLKSYIGPETAKKRRFSFKEWMESDDPKHRAVILRLDMKNKSLVESLFPFFVEFLAVLLDGIPDGAMRNRKPSWLILDEFAQLQKMRTILKFYELGRSKGFRTLLATQAPSQIVERYGREGSQTFQSASNLKIVFRMATGAEQESVARDILGDREIQFRSASVSSGSGGLPSVSSSLQSKKIPVYYPSELGSRLGFWMEAGSWKRRVRQFLHSKFPNRIAASGPDKFIRAALVGDDEILELDWPILDFPDRRPGTEKEKLLPRYKDGFAKALQILQGSASGDRDPEDRIRLLGMNERDIKWMKILVRREAKAKALQGANPEKAPKVSEELTESERKIFEKAAAEAAAEIESLEQAEAEKRAEAEETEREAAEAPKRKSLKDFKRKAGGAAIAGAGAVGAEAALADDFADLESLIAPEGEGDSIEDQMEEIAADGIGGIGEHLHAVALLGDALDALSSPSQSPSKDERGRTRDQGLGGRRSSLLE